MYFKAVLRQDRDVRYSVPPTGTPVTVRIQDARENIIQTLELATNKFGTLNGEFHIAPGAALGDYTIEVLIGAASHQQTFKVQEYRKPDIKIEMEADADKYVAGDTVTIAGNVSYFFGEPVPNAQVTVRRFYLVRNYYWGWWDENAAVPGYTWYSYDAGNPPTLRADAEGLRYAFTASEVDEYARCLLEQLPGRKLWASRSRWMMAAGRRSARR
jgi:hypothetical protein